MKKILAVVFALFSTPVVAQNYLRDDGIFHSVVEGTTNGQFLINNGGVLGGTSISAISLAIGTTPISGGVDSRILFDHAGVLGEYTLTGSGMVVAMQNAPTFTGLTTITRNATAWAPLGATSLHIKGGDTGEARIELTAANSDSVLVAGRMNGTFAAPTHLLTNDQMIGLIGVGIDTDGSTTMQQGGALGGFAGGAWTASSHPFYWDIFTIPSGSTSFNTVSRFGMSGGLSVGAASDMPTGVISAATGFRIANAATSGNVLRGNGTNFVSAQLAAADLSGTATAATANTLMLRDASGNVSINNINAAAGTFSSFVLPAGGSVFSIGASAASGTLTTGFFNGGATAGSYLALQAGTVSYVLIGDRRAITGTADDDFLIQTQSGDGFHIQTNGANTDRLSISTAGVVLAPVLAFTTSLTANGSVGITKTCTIAVGNVLTFTLGILTATSGVAGCV